MRSMSLRESDGFTLVELLIVVAVLPLVVGSITAGFLVTLSNKNTTQSRFSDSHDAQLTSTYFVRDVQSASLVSTSGSTFCGRSSYLLGLAWYQQPSDTTITSESVYALTNGLLTRTTCGGTSGTETLAHDWNPQTSANGSVTATVTVFCSDGSRTCADSPTPIPTTTTNSNKASVNQIAIHVVENRSGYTFRLNASPNGWSVTGAGCAQSGSCPGKATPPPLHMIGTDSAVTLGPNCNVNVTGIAATDNSTPNKISGGSFNATEIYWTGTSGGPASNSNVPVVSGPPLADSFAGLTPPARGSAGVTTIQRQQDWPASNVLSGIYYVSGSVNINSALTDVDPSTQAKNPVLIYVAPGGSLSMTGSGSLDIETPTPAYDPIVIWAASSGQNVSLNGGSTLNGTIYDPNGTVVLNGGGSSGQISATTIDANKLLCNGGGASVGVNAGPVSTTTSVTATPNPVSDGHMATLKAQVNASGGSTVDEGSVAFVVKDGTGSVTADCATPIAVDGSGSASCQTSPLSGSLSHYKITASYQGTSNFGPSTTSSATDVNVLKQTTTTATTTASNLHSGDTATFNATVVSGGQAPSKGAVTFTEKDTNGATVAVSSAKTIDTNGSATWTSGPMYAGSAPYSVTVTYTDGNNTTTSIYTDSTSDPVAVPVTIATTSTTVIANKPTTRPGGSVTFTATVTPTPASGSVNWSLTSSTDLNPPSCTPNTTALDSNGQATCVVNGGWHLNSVYTISATYPGSTNFTGSSGSASEAVATSGTTTAARATLSSNGHSAQDVATVLPVDRLDGTPTGFVIFYLCTNTSAGCTASPSQQVGSPIQLVGGTATSPTLSSTGNSAVLSNNKHYCMAAVYQGSIDAQGNADNNFAGSFDYSDASSSPAFDQCFST